MREDRTRRLEMWILTPLIWLSFAGYGYWIATIKRRNPGEGVLYGLLLGPLGCVVEACLRERAPEEIEEERTRRQEEAKARLEEERDRQAALRADAILRRQEAQVRADAARARRADAFGRFSDWFDRAVLKFGWYRGLPEVVQPIVIGLLVALPLVVVMILVFRGR